MNSFRENFNSIREENSRVFDALERALKKMEVDFYLIGAQSRDVWVRHIELKGKRTTTDIDYLVYVKDRATWNALIQHLQEEQFTRDEERPYRFGNIDLIPFGGLEENGEVMLEDPAMILSVVGCREVTQRASVTEGDFKIVTLPGLCILKLIAFDEKPDQRAKDYDDYLFLLRHYHEIAGAEIFNGDHDDLITGDFDFKIVSARLLGRQLKTILDASDQLRDKIVQNLQNRLGGFTMKEIDEMYAVDDRNSKVEEFKLVAETIRGLNDTY